MTNKIKLIIMDMDDTLLNSKGDIPEKNKSVLDAARRAGIHVTLASGRMFRSELAVAKQLGITDPLVAYNGAMIRYPLPPQTTISHHTLTASQVLDALSILEPFGAHINAYLDDELYVEEETSHAREYAVTKNAPYHLVDSFKTMPSLAFTKMLVIEPRQEVMNEIRRVLTGRIGAEIFFSSRTFCEIMPRGINKGTGLEFLCSHLGISLSNVIAFGDQENDIPMIKKAGIGVAMGNAQPAVKEAADEIAPDCDASGVAETLLLHLPELKDHL